MSNIAELADQHACRASEMREIARGIWDEIERKAFMDFITDYERLARALKARDFGVTMPVRAMINSR